MIRDKEILQEISKKTKIPKEKISAVIDELKQIIKESAKKGEGVLISDFIRISYIKRNGETKTRITPLFEEPRGKKAD